MWQHRVVDLQRAGGLAGLRQRKARMNWLKAVSEASSEPTLLAVVNEYLLQHPDDYWSWIPRDSRPTLVATVQELHHWHRKLSDKLASATMPNIRMQDVCVFFLRASARALELEQQSQRAPSSNDDEANAPSKRNGD